MSDSGAAVTPGYVALSLSQLQLRRDRMKCIKGLVPHSSEENEESTLLLFSITITITITINTTQLLLFTWLTTVTIHMTLWDCHCEHQYHAWVVTTTTGEVRVKCIPMTLYYKESHVEHEVSACICIWYVTLNCIMNINTRRCPSRLQE